MVLRTKNTCYHRNYLTLTVDHRHSIMRACNLHIWDIKTRKLFAILPQHSFESRARNIEVAIRITRHCAIDYPDTRTCATVERCEKLERVIYLNAIRLRWHGPQPPLPQQNHRVL